MTVCDPIHHRTAQPRYESDDDTDDGATQDNEFVANRIFDTIQPALAEFGFFRDRAALDQQIDDLGEGKQTQPDNNQGNPVHKVVDPEGVPILSDCRGIPDGPQHETNAGTDDALYRLVSRKHPHHGHSQDGQHKQLR